MLRIIEIHGPYQALEATNAVGRRNLLDFRDYGMSDESEAWCGISVIFDDEEEAECDVLSQVRTLLSEFGADAVSFRVAKRYFSYPDAMPIEWYVLINKFGCELLNLEALGVRTDYQQNEMDHLRGNIRYRCAAASEQAEANIEKFMSDINYILGD